MGRNTGNGGRLGTVKNRTQTFNPNTNMYVKRDSETGRFLSCKETPYKSIRKEDSIQKKSKN